MPFRQLPLLLVALSLSVALNAQAPTDLTAEAIMAHVAANQESSEAERAHYLYVQHAHLTSRKGSTVMCEETSDVRVTPTPAGSQQQLLKLDGRMLVKHKYIAYNSLLPDKDSPKAAPTSDPKALAPPPVGPDNKPAVESEHDSLSINIGGDDTDRQLVEGMRNSLTNDKSKDGINDRLFPLTRKGQQDYAFHLVGREHLNGREVFHIEFRPKDKSEFTWKGDAYIDSTAFQPVVIRTDMARKIPFAVRTLLGTNIPGYGFNIIYAPQPDGVWLPVSLGTEFKIHVLFFFSRQIIIDAQNRDFEKTHVTSKILPGT